MQCKLLYFRFIENIGYRSIKKVSILFVKMLEASISFYLGNVIYNIFNIFLLFGNYLYHFSFLAFYLRKYNLLY